MLGVKSQSPHHVPLFLKTIQGLKTLYCFFIDFFPQCCKFDLIILLCYNSFVRKNIGLTTIEEYLRKYILSLLTTAIVLVVCIQDALSSTVNFDRFKNYGIIEKIIELDKQKSDVIALALNIYHEARGSSYEDKLAVAEVTMNRYRSGKFGDSIYEVVYQPKQFSWTFLIRNEIPKEKLSWIECQEIAYNVFNENKNKIINDNVYHYVRYDIIDDVAWAKEFNNRKKIGAHIYLY